MTTNHCGPDPEAIADSVRPTMPFELWQARREWTKSIDTAKYGGPTDPNADSYQYDPGFLYPALNQCAGHICYDDGSGTWSASDWEDNEYEHGNLLMVEHWLYTQAKALGELPDWDRPIDQPPAHRATVYLEGKTLYAFPVPDDTDVQQFAANLTSENGHFFTGADQEIVPRDLGVGTLSVPDSGHPCVDCNNERPLIDGLSCPTCYDKHNERNNA